MALIVPNIIYIKRSTTRAATEKTLFQKLQRVKFIFFVGGLFVFFKFCIVHYSRCQPCSCLAMLLLVVCVCPSKAAHSVAIDSS